MDQEEQDVPIDAPTMASPEHIRQLMENATLGNVPEIGRDAVTRVKEALDSILDNELSRYTSTLTNTFEIIAKEWQKPLAINVFSDYLGVADCLPKIPVFDFTWLDSAAFKLPAVDWDSINDRYQRTLRFAAQHNWFIQPETGCTFPDEIDACNEDVARLDALFVDTTNQVKSQIHARLLRDHPRHGPQIEELFRLHEEGRYLASIPLTMIVAEGIAHDVTQTSIFNMNKNRPAIAGWLKKQELTDLAKAFLSSFEEQYPMSKPRPGKLCRHMVLHGIDTNYGSELFSWQAISLLGFVGWTFAADGLIVDDR